MMTWTPVNSEWITESGFDPQTLEMSIRTIRGGQYDTPNVPQQVYDEFLKAPSKGKYWNTWIKNR